MTITLRQKHIKNGNISLYLDYYEKGKREYEFLDLYLIPDNAPDAHKLNNATLKKATAIRAERVINPASRFCKQGNAVEKKAVNTPKLTEWIQTQYENKVKAGYSNAVLWNIIHIKKLIEDYLAFSKKKEPTLGKVDKKFIIGFLHYLKNDHVNPTYRNSVRHLSDGSLKQYQQRLIAILNDAVKEQLIEKNPFDELSGQELFSTPESSRIFLTIDELKKFMEAKKCLSRTIIAKENQMAFVFGCFTGLRISDIRALRWCDIQGINGIPHVRSTMIKTKKPLFLPLSMNAMLWLPKRDENAKDTDHVFTKLPKQSSLNDFVQRLAKSAGINKHITFHTSRHTFATLTLKACKDLFVVSKLLGHANINTTKVYAEVMESSLEEAISMTEGIFGNGSSTCSQSDISL